MSNAPSTSTPDANDPKIEMRWSTVRNLIAAVIVAVCSLAGGVGGAATIKGEMPAEVRSALDDIRNTLTRIETRDEARVKDAGELKQRVDSLEKDVRALERKAPTK
jgi:outer membrane murein-binding lipoprotein Lpp